MADRTYSFSVGTCQCTPVNDGYFSYPAAWMFANVSREDREKRLRAYGARTDEIATDYTCLLVSTGKNKVLIDTGAGKMAPSTGELLVNLEKAGARRGDIDTVILTHAHPDHVGGAVDAEGKPAFPNARYVIWKDEWEFWTSDAPDLSALPLPEEVKTGLLIGTARRCLLALRKQVEIVEKEAEVVPGIYLLPAPGHTPGHAAVALSSGKDAVLHIADTVLHPLLMEQPAWRTVFDLKPEQAAGTRQRLLDRAATDKTMVMAYHFPFPTLGKVISRPTGGWRWEAAA